MKKKKLLKRAERLSNQGAQPSLGVREGLTGKVTFYQKPRKLEVSQGKM